MSSSERLTTAADKIVRAEPVLCQRRAVLATVRRRRGVRTRSLEYFQHRAHGPLKASPLPARLSPHRWHSLRASGAQPAAAGAPERGADLVLLGRRRPCCSCGRRSGAVGSAVRPSSGSATPRPQHYVQSLCQLTVYAYWGWYWPPVYDFVPLLLGAAALCLRVRHAAVVVAGRRVRARLRPVPDRLQHESVSLVQGRLVRPAVRC